jgi:hypothetical protein
MGKNNAPAIRNPHLSSEKQTNTCVNQERTLAIISIIPKILPKKSPI